ncbi:hypothetical protein DAPPUDRAFT_102590 [Daphnia pulex]|uniref:Uncharacterized protein n=1 Tax=Daphnia pulex TaxID=6669 RepID=E9GGT2_DAPPU|nr:hypothetical protein DAPPUDRAFT_102590 [Daphnia pulex]|eukprot:EFX81079.1 hypothetical protein DAPPUDRAFT_102590 [Daphnia pulex]
MIGVRIVASTPLDEVIRPTPQTAVSPIEVLVTSLAQVTITHQVTISPADEIHLAEWSSRFSLPVPAREETVELRQGTADQPSIPATADESDDSDNEDDTEGYKWQILPDPLRKQAPTLFDGLADLSGKKPPTKMYPSLGVVRAGLGKTGAVQRFCKRVGRSYLGKMPIHAKPR